MKSNSLDFIKALELLFPFKERLSEIYEAYLNDEFQSDVLPDYPEPWEVLYDYFYSPGYAKYKVRPLTVDIYYKTRELRFECYTFKNYIELEKKFYAQDTYEFNELWSLEDIYLMLLHILHYKDPITIEHSIINGELLKIIEGFQIRI